MKNNSIDFKEFFLNNYRVQVPVYEISKVTIDLLDGICLEIYNPD